MLAKTNLVSFISGNQHTSLNSPYRRKNDLQETHDDTVKLFPRGVSPQMLHSNDKLGSRRAVSCLRSIFLNQIHMTIVLVSLIIKS